MERLRAGHSWRLLDQKLTLKVLLSCLSTRVGPGILSVYLLSKQHEKRILWLPALSFSFLQLRCVEDLQTIQVIKILRYEKKVAKMCFLMIFIFLIFWMPYIVICFMVVNGYGHLVTPTVSLVSSLFAKSSTVYNPIIYIIMIRKVSVVIYTLFSPCRCGCWKM